MPLLRLASSAQSAQAKAGEMCIHRYKHSHQAKERCLSKHLPLLSLRRRNRNSTKDSGSNSLPFSRHSSRHFSSRGSSMQSSARSLRNSHSNHWSSSVRSSIRSSVRSSNRSRATTTSDSKQASLCVCTFPGLLRRGGSQMRASTLSFLITEEHLVIYVSVRCVLPKCAKVVR